MKKIIATTLICAFLVATASASTVSYKILLDGQDKDTYTAADFSDLNNIEVTIQAMVTDNQVQAIDLGASLLSLNLDSSNGIPGNLQFAEKTDAFGGSTGLWDATLGSSFTKASEGTLDSSGHDVLAICGYIADISSNYAVGAQAWVDLISGSMAWDGSDTELSTSISDVSWVSVVNYDGGFASVTADTVIQDSATLSGGAAVPEPSTIALLLSSLLAFGLVANRRNK